MTSIASWTGFARRLALAATLAVAVAAVPGAPTAGAQERTLPQSRAQIQLSFAPLVRQAAPAVVNIYTRKLVRRAASPLFDDPLFRRFFGDQFRQGAPSTQVQNSLGSGVVVRPDGLIVTNHHVIDGADEITVVLDDRREFAARLVGSDERTDLAALRIDVKGERLPYLELGDSDALQVGDLVLAIGNPFGVGQTVTSGIVSALARTTVGITDYQYFIQTDAAINPGNSGGALIAMDGRLIGINTAIYSRNGAGSVGIGFAIPANMVASVVRAFENGEKIVRPWLGASGQPVTADLAASFGLARPAGVVVTEIAPGGPADRAGLQRGDVITEIDGRPVEDPQALRFRLATLPVGETARVTVLRRGRPVQLSVALLAPPETPPRDLTEIGGRTPLTGLTLGNLSPAFAEELGVDSTQRGVIVVAMRRGSIAQRLGFRPGDVVLRLNGEAVQSVDHLTGLLQAQPIQKIDVRREGEVLSLVFGG